MYRGAAGEIEDTKLPKESSVRPYHVGKRAVYESRPEEDERNQRQETSPLACATDGDDTNCCFEYQLEFTEEDSWDSADGIRQHTAMEGIFEITEDAATIPVGKSVSDDEPLYGATCDYQYGGVK